MIEVRVLTEADADPLWALRLEALEREPLAFATSADEHRSTTPADFAHGLSVEAGSNFIVGAFEDGRLCAMAGFAREARRKTQHKGRVWGVYVSKSARGKGVGCRLLKALLARAQTYDDIEQVELCVTAPQIVAKKLYESLGFRHFGTEPCALKVQGQCVDEEHMVLSLRDGN